MREEIVLNFKPTKFASAEEKLRFYNHTQKFINSGFHRRLFTLWYYRRLSNCFGHIAHYDSHGFYYEWFSSAQKQRDFLLSIIEWPCYGAPDYTFSDVERAIQLWVRAVYPELIQLARPGVIRLG